MSWPLRLGLRLGHSEAPLPHDVCFANFFRSVIMLDQSLRVCLAFSRTVSPILSFWSNPRPISNSQLHALLHFHLCPINLIVSQGSYFFKRMGYLILRGASRLDAFSVYPFRTWLLCHASGDATDTPAVRPPRSSRTKGSSSQISCAHAG